TCPQGKKTDEQLRHTRNTRLQETSWTGAQIISKLLGRLARNRSKCGQCNGADQKYKSGIGTCECENGGQNSGKEGNNTDGPFTFEQATHNEPLLKCKIAKLYFTDLLPSFHLFLLLLRPVHNCAEACLHVLIGSRDRHADELTALFTEGRARHKSDARLIENPFADF